MNMKAPRLEPFATTIGSLILCAGLLTGCVLVAAAPGASAASTKGLSLSGCSPSAIPSGFVLDAVHSGSMSPAQYSASGDIQASMIYDHYKRGLRDVYTDLSPSADVGQDLVIECIAMQFSSPANANRFLQSFKYLRSQAGSVAQKVALPKRLNGASVAYREEQQAFSGYHITSTNVIEAADQRGVAFYVVSVAGQSPQMGTAFGFLKRIASQA